MTKIGKARIVNSILLVILIIISLLSIAVLLDNRTRLTERFNELNESVTTLEGKLKEVDKRASVIPKNGKDGITTIVHEYKEVTIPGKDGKDGVAGKSTYELAIDNGFIGSERDWVDSLKPTVLFPSIRCNTIKNRWEIKYPIDETWKVMNGEIVPCLGFVTP